MIALQNKTGESAETNHNTDNYLNDIFVLDIFYLFYLFLLSIPILQHSELFCCVK